MNFYKKYPLVLFHNVVFMGVQVKTQEWCEAFVKTMGMKLETSNSLYNELIYLAYVKLSFGDYDKAIVLIQQLDSPEKSDVITPKDHIFISLFYYQVFIHLYFKVETELALKKNDALRKFFNRNKENISPLKGIKLDNFIKFTRRIITTPKYSTKWTKLKDNISTKRNEIAFTRTINFMIKNKT